MQLANYFTTNFTSQITLLKCPQIQIFFYLQHELLSIQKTATISSGTDRILVIQLYHMKEECFSHALIDWLEGNWSSSYPSEQVTRNKMAHLGRNCLDVFFSSAFFFSLCDLPEVRGHEAKLFGGLSINDVNGNDNATNSEFHWLSEEIMLRCRTCSTHLRTIPCRLLQNNNVKLPRLRF